MNSWVRKTLQTALALILCFSFVTPTVNAAINNATNQLANNIISLKNGKPKTATQTLLVNQRFTLTTQYRDYENDPEDGRSWQIEHDPNAVENNEGLSSLHGQTVSSLPNAFDKPGVYTLNLTVRDNPGLSSFKKTSENVSAVIRVHRKPTALFAVTASGSNLSYTDYSFDIDAQSWPDRGIASRSWSYWYKDDGTVYNGRPNTYTTNRTIVIALTVTDHDGATDTFVTEVGAGVPVKNPVTKVIAPDVVYVGQTFEATDETNPGTGHITQWSWSTTTNALGNSKTATSAASKEYAIRYTSAGNKTVSLTVRNSAGRTAGASKTVQAIATAINGNNYSGLFPGEQITVQATTTNVVSAHHNVVATVFKGTEYETKLSLEPASANTWRQDFAVPLGVPAGTYPLEYAVIYKGTNEVLSVSNRTIGILEPPAADIAYRIKTPTGFVPLDDDALFAYFGDKGHEVVNATEVVLHHNSGVFARQWQDSEGNSGSGATFEHAYLEEKPVTTRLRIQDNVSRTKAAGYQWSEWAEKTIAIKEVAITPLTEIGGIVPEKLFNIRANVAAGSRNGAANPDLDVSVRVLKNANGVETVLLDRYPMQHASGNIYELDYALIAGSEPSGENVSYRIEYSVHSARSGDLLAQEVQALPVSGPSIVGNDYDSLPFKTIDIQAETTLVDPAVHWVRVRLPDADIGFASSEGDMQFDPDASEWSMYYTVPMVPETKGYTLVYEVVSRHTGQVVASDVKTLTIRPPTAVASNPDKAHVYDVVELNVDTENATPEDYIVTASVFGQTFELEYDPDADDWSYDLAIPKDYSFDHTVTYNVIAKARPNAALITIDKPLTVLTWLKDARVIDPLTGESVTTLIPKKPYMFEIDSSLNVESVDGFAERMKMDNRIFTIAFPLLGNIKTVENTLDPNHRHKTWFVETVFEFDYPYEGSDDFILPGSIPFAGTTYDGKSLTHSLDHAISISMAMDWRIPPKASIGLPLRISSTETNATGQFVNGPVIVSNVPLDRVDVYFHNVHVGRLTLHAPTYADNVYTYRSDLFEHWIPPGTPEGMYPVTLRATATNFSYITETKTVEVVENQPPTVSLSIQSPIGDIYEGDNVVVDILPDDPDDQPLTVELYHRVNGGAWAKVFAATDVLPKQVQTVTLPYVPVGDHELRAVVTDPMTASAEAFLSFEALPFEITGTVTHTPEWLNNLQRYNDAALAAGRPTRPFDWFFPGEKFVLHAQTSPVAVAVHVRLEGTSFADDLTFDGTRWNGSIWDESMLRWSTRDVTVTFTAASRSGFQKQDQVTVRVVDDDYWRQHRSH